MALKLHIIHRTLRSTFKFLEKNKEKENESSELLLKKFIKTLLATDSDKNYPKYTENLLRYSRKSITN